MIFAPMSAVFAGILAKGGITLDPIAKPLAAVLAFFYSLVPNYGIAIVMLTIAMMLVLTPLTIKQTRSMLVMQKLQPQMKRLQELHKNDRQALNEAVMQLYKEHNASPLGGCLPMLLPLPVFIALLRVLEGLSRTVHGTPMPKYLTAHTQMSKDIVKAGGQLDAFGMNLAKSASTIGGSLGHKLPYFVLLLVMVGTQYYQQHQLTSRNPQAQGQPGQAAMMKFIPLFFGLISVRFPAGVVIYWTVSNIIRIGQQWAMYRYDPKVKALVAKDIKEIEDKTREIESRQQKSKPVGRSRMRDLLSNAADAGADKKQNTDKPAAGRSRMRDLLTNAAEAAADRKQNANKPAAKGGDKSAAGGKGSPGGQPRAGTARPAGKGTPGTTKGSPATAKGTSGPPKGGTGTAKGAPGRAGDAKAGSSSRAGGAKPGAGSNGGAKPPAKAQPAARKGQHTANRAQPAANKSQPAAKAPASSAPRTQPAANKPPATAAPETPAQSGANGSSGGASGSNKPSGGNGTGRTGAGGARSVSSRHRRARRGR